MNTVNTVPRCITEASTRTLTHGTTKTQCVQAGTGEVLSGRGVSSRIREAATECRARIFSHLTVLRVYFDPTRAVEVK